MKEIFSHYQPQPLGQKKVYSVLLPLIKIRGEWHILYQVRSETIPQPGDVSFPGGAVEAGESLQEAAIRETCEELQLDPGQIDLFGEIDYFVHHHRTIHCFVGQLLVEDWPSIHKEDLEQMEIRELIRGDFTPPVQIDVPVDQLFAQSLKQNFVPVVDDRQIFIGIVTRQSIIQYLMNNADKYM